MFINRVGGGGGENVTAQVQEQTALLEELKTLVSGSLRPTGHIWFKYPIEGGPLQEVLVSDEADTYPNGDGGDGYEYIKVTHALATDAEGNQYILEI